METTNRTGIYAARVPGENVHLYAKTGARLEPDYTFCNLSYLFIVLLCKQISVLVCTNIRNEFFTADPVFLIQR